jgi:hypothetical protein
VAATTLNSVSVFGRRPRHCAHILRSLFPIEDKAKRQTDPGILLLLNESSVASILRDLVYCIYSWDIQCFQVLLQMCQPTAQAYPQMWQGLPVSSRIPVAQARPGGVDHVFGEREDVPAIGPDKLRELMRIARQARALVSYPG